MFRERCDTGCPDVSSSDSQRTKKELYKTLEAHGDREPAH